MQNYAPGYPVVVTFNLASESGTLITPTALRWRVLDEAETVLQDWATQAIPSPAEGEIALTIIGVLNILTPPAVRGLRTVELEVTTERGSYLLSESVLLQSVSALRVGMNTFQTYFQALLESQNHVESSITGWVRSTARDERERALIQAHQAILQLPLRMKNARLNSQSYMTEDPFISHGRIWLRDVTPENFQELTSEAMKIALRQAQLLEASEILSADPVAVARRSGLMSMTVGESSQFFGQSKPMDTPMLSRLGMDLLKRWMDHSVTMARAS
jgi:hypothetical protein